MFVDIENPKTPLKVTNILTAYDKGVVVKGVRQPPQKLTPKVCFDILKSTNYPRCIRDILQLIAKLPDEEQAQFKDVVLACFDNREQPTDIFQLGQELAEKSGYGIEFAKLKKINEGPYLYSEADAQKCYMCFKSEFINEDFRTYDKVVFLSDKKIQFGKDVNFPKNMDVSKCDEVNLNWCDLQGVQSIRFKDGAKVDLGGAYNLPANLDFSQCSEVNLSYCVLSEQPNLRFKNGAKIDLCGAYYLPENLDFSQCSAVNLRECDLSGQPNLRFKNGAKIDLCGAYHLPENVDFSQCSAVNLRECDLSEQPNLCFYEGAKVYLNGAENLPENLDFSMCDEVKLSGCDLSEQPNLCFKEGAKVDLSWAKNLPPNLDFSICDEVDLHYCNLSRVQKLVFKNRQQMQESQAYFPDGWKGKIVFADEQPEPPSLGLAMSAKAKGGR